MPRLPRPATTEVPLIAEDGGTVYEGMTESLAEVDMGRVERESEDDALRALMQIEGAADCRWQVFRLLPADEAGFIMEVTTAELSIGYIAKKCGPGKYRVRGFHPNGRYAGMRTFQVAKGIEPSTAMVPTSPPLNDYLSMIDRQKLLAKEDIKFWAALLVPVLAPALVQLLARKESGIGELVSAMRGLQGISQGDSAISKLSELKELMGVIREFSPEKESVGSTWVDLIRDGVKEIAPMASAVIAQRANAPKPPFQLTGLTPATTQSESNPMLHLLNWFKEQLQFLVTKAAQNRDPELYADFLADNLPHGVKPEQLKEWLGREDWWKLFVGFSPAVAPYEGWFTALRNALLELIDASINPDSVDE